MANSNVSMTGVERHFSPDEIIVSKTDTKGRMTYANDVFLRISGYDEGELLGLPHSLIRHPDMPRCVFKLLWDFIESGREIFAYVLNRAKCGDHYWVFAHVTPSFDDSGRIIGYHSNRRVPRREALEKVIPVYKTLLDIENRHGGGNEGMSQAMAAMVSLLKEKGVDYDEFVFSL